MAKKIHVESLRGISIPFEFQDRYYATRNHDGRINPCIGCGSLFYDTSPRVTYKECFECRFQSADIDESISEEKALLVPGRTKECLSCSLTFLDQSLSGARNFCRRCIADYSYDELAKRKKPGSVKVLYVFNAADHRDEVLSLYDGVRTDINIANQIGITGDQVSYIRRKLLKLPRPTHDAARAKDGFKTLASLTKEDIELRIRVLKEPYELVAKDYGVATSTIRRVRKNLGARPKFDFFPEVSISDIVHQYIIGHLLGDGFLRVETSKLAASFRVSHKADHKEYTVASQDAFGDLVSRTINDEGRTKELMYGFETISSPSFLKYYDDFYDPSLRSSKRDKDYKRPPMWCFEQMTPLSLALWYQDDGSLDFDSGTVGIACCFRSFDYQKMCDILGGVFKIRFYTLERTPKLTMLHVRGEKDRRRFFDTIAPYINQKMSYKLPRGLYERHYEAFEGRDELSQIFNPEIYRDLPLTDKSKYVDDAVGFILTKSFPYSERRQTPFSSLKEQLVSSTIDHDNKLPSSVVYGLDYLDEIFPHRFTANHEGKPSPVVAWSDPLWLKKSFESLAKFNTPVTIKKLRARIIGLVNAPGHFKPTSAAAVYDRYKPKSILDPMIGWGARALAAMCLDVPRYVGIDLQEASVNGVRRIFQDFQNLTRSTVHVHHGNALEVMRNYSDEFDMIMAGPPYFNVENYNGVAPSGTLQQWINEFVDPFCFLASKVLKRNGVFVLHIFDTHKHGFIEPFMEKCLKYGFFMKIS